MKRPDNIVYNSVDNVYDAFKKNYPTNFSSKNFTIEKINDIKVEAQPYFKQRFNEIKKQYQDLFEKLEWNEIIHNSKYNFNPIIGEKYHLYKTKKHNFLSIISPSEWDRKYIGTFKLCSNYTWKKIN
tara:strand:+ start:297 stop:677 length:381 start_codon:yes stop_codon:yes gene_type:complete